MTKEQLANFLKRQSYKKLKALQEFYENRIMELAMNDEEEHGENIVLEAIKFEVMKRDLKKVTRELNKKIHLD